MPRMSLVLRRGEFETSPKRHGSFLALARKTVYRSKTQSAVARLGQLVMYIGAGSLPSLADDPTLISRIEAHISQSGDRELQQLVKEYLAEV